MNTIIRSYLIELARKKYDQLITYQRLSDDCNLGLNMVDNPYDRSIIGKLLAEISIFEYNNNRPLLSALVIRAGDNSEGDGFYKLAEELGFGNWQKLKKEGEFEIIQIKRCIEFWSDDRNHQKYR